MTDQEEQRLPNFPESEVWDIKQIEDCGGKFSNGLTELEQLS
jgi:hypothetical protein